MGDSWYRIAGLPKIFRHLIEVTRIIADGVNAHVPEEDRKVDARTLLPTFGLQAGAAGATGRQRPTIPNAFSTVPRTQSLVAVSGSC